MLKKLTSILLSFLMVVTLVQVNTTKIYAEDEGEVGQVVNANAPDESDPGNESGQVVEETTPVAQIATPVEVDTPISITEPTQSVGAEEAVPSVAVSYVAKIGDTSYETLQAAIDAATEGQTVTLLTDVTLTSQLEINKSIILDGNNQTITRNDVNDTDAGLKSAILVDANNVTIKNLTVSGPNTNPKDDSNVRYWDEGEFGIKVYNATNVTLTDVTVKDANSGIQVNGSSVTMTGTIDVSGNEWGGIEVCHENAALDLTDATLVNEDESEDVPVLWNDDTKGTISFNTNQTLYVKAVDNTKDHYYLSGQATVTNASNVVTGYRSLKAAITNAADDSTVTLLTDVDLGGNGDEASDVVINKAITLDLNGHTVKNKAWNVFDIDADVTITGNGTIENTYEDNVADVENRNGFDTLRVRAGTTTIENGTFVNNSMYGATIYAKESGNVVIEGGTFTNKAAANFYYGSTEPKSAYATLNKSNSVSCTSTITVSGGTFTGDPAKGDDNKGGTFVAEGYKSVANDDGTYTVVPKTYVAEVTSGSVTTKYESLQEAVNAATDGSTITVLADIDNCVIDTNTNNNSFTLDLNGHKLTNYAESYTKLDDYSGRAVITNRGSGTITIKGGTIETKYMYNILVMNGKVVIENGTFINDSNDNYNIYAKGTGIVEIKGGTFTNKNTDTYIYNTNCKSLNLNIQNDVTPIENIIVTGGTFTADPAMGDDSKWGTSSFVANDYKSVANDNGTYTVKAKDYVAINTHEGVTTKYESLQDAVNAAVNNDVVTMIADEDIADPVVVSGQKTITIDMAGHKLYNTKDIWDQTNGDFAMIIVTGSSNLTITGNGIIDAKENDCFALEVCDKDSSITIENGTFNGNLHTVYAMVGKVYIKGGTYNLKQIDDGKGYSFELNCLDDNYTNGTAKIIVTGGTFTNFNPAANAAESSGNTTNFVAEGYAVHSTTSGNNTLYTVGKAVAEITSNSVTTKYASLQDAVNAATEGQTVKVLEDITLFTARVDVSKSITIDLNGKTITPTASCGNGSAFNIKSGTVTITNGTIDASAIDGVTNSQSLPYGKEVDAITVRSGATLNVSDLTITVNSTTGSCLYAFDGGKINVTSGTYTNTATGVGPANEKSMTLNQGDIETQLIFVSGGTFHGANPADGDNSGKCTTFLATNYKSVENPTGTYTVVAKTEVAKIGNIVYESLQEAVNAAGNGDTVKLLNNISVSERITSTNSNSFTLDLNGKTITSTADVGLVNDGTGTITITGNGTIDVSGATDPENDTIWAISGNITIKNGTYINNSNNDATIYASGSSVVTIEGGTYTNKKADEFLWGSDPKSDFAALNVKDDSAATIVVYGGTFTGDPAKGDNTKGGTFLVSTKISKYNEKTGYYEVVDAAVRIGDKGYETFADALNAYTAGDVITVLTNLESAPVIGQGQKIIVNWNNKTVMTPTTTGAYVVTATNNENGTVTYTSTEAYISLTSGSTVSYYSTLKDAEANANNGDTIKLLKDVGLGLTTLTTAKNLTIDVNGQTLTLANELTINGELTIVDTAETKGKVYANSIININGTLDFTNLTFGTDSGLIKGQSGSMHIGTAGTVKMSRAIGTYYLVPFYNPSNKAASIAGGNPNFLVASVGSTVVYDGTDYVCTAVRKNATDNGDIWNEKYVAQIGETKYGSLQEAITAATDGDTIKLIADEDVAESIIITDKNITLDLNGKKLYNTTDIWDEEASTFAMISIRGTSNVTITGNGTIDTKDNDEYVFHLYGTPTLTVENGTFDGNLDALYVESGTAYIKGGTFSIVQTYDKTPYDFMLNCLDGNYKNGTAKIIVTGGTFKNYDPSNNVAEGPNTNLVADDYKSVDNGDGTYTVVPKTYVAQIGENKYESLQEAVDAATDGSTVKLLADITVTDEVVNESNSNSYTLDLNGYVLSCNTKSTTFKNNNASSLITITDSSATKTGAIKNGYSTETDRGHAVWARSGSITINGGYFENNSIWEATIYVGDGSANDTSVVIINGGTFRNIADGNYPYKDNTKPLTLNVKNNKSYTSLVINDGIFYGNNPSDGDDNLGGTFVAKGKVAKYNSTGGYYEIVSAVVEIGSKGYLTLTDALNDAKAGDTVSLLKDVTVEIADGAATYDAGITIDKAITLDGNNHSISLAGSNWTAMNNGKWDNDCGKYHVINVTANGATIKNLTINAKNGELVSRSGIHVYLANNVTIDNVAVHGATTYGVIVNGSSNVTLTNLVATGNTWGVDVDNTKGNTSVTINGTDTNIAYTASEQITKGGLVIEGNSTNTLSVNINAGTISDIEIKTGSANVTSTNDIDDSKVVVPEGYIWTGKTMSRVAAKIGQISYASITDALNAVVDETETTIVLQQNLTEDVTIPANKIINLDLNSTTLTTTGLTNNGTLVISNGVITGTSNNAVITNNDGLTIEENVAINTTGSPHCVIDTNGELIINGGSIDGAIYNYKDATINGGTISGELQSIVTSDDKYDAVMNITGGKFTCTGYTVFSLIGRTDHKASIVITGGTFSVDPTETGLLKDKTYEAVNNDDGTYTVGKRTSGVGVTTGSGEHASTDYYGTLQDAIEAAGETNGNVTVTYGSESSPATKDPITATIDDNVTLVVNQLANGKDAQGRPVAVTNNITPAVGCRLITSSVGDEDSFTITYAAIPLSVGQKVLANGNITTPADSGYIYANGNYVDNSVSVVELEGVGENTSAEAASVAGSVGTDDGSLYEIVDTDTFINEVGITEAELAKAWNESNNTKVTSDNAYKLSARIDTYFAVTVNDIEVAAESNSITSLTMDIKPMYQVFAELDDESVEVGTGNEIDVTDETSSTGYKTIAMSVVLPSGFVTSTNDKVYVKHVSENGTKTYETTVTEIASDVYLITFDNPDGFSEFEISKISYDDSIGNKVSLNLDGSVGVNFYIAVDAYTGSAEASDNATAYLEYNKNYTSYDSSLTTDTIAISEVTPDADGLYKFSCKVNPVAIADSINLTIKDSEGKVLYSVKDYSVAKYCEAVLNNASSDAKLKAVCQGLIDYGSYAQTYFNYNANALTAVRTSASKLGSIPNTVEGVKDELLNEAGIRREARTMVCYSSTTLREYVGFNTSSYSASQYEISTSGDLGNVTVKKVNSAKTINGQSYPYYIDIANIAPANFDVDYTITVTNTKNSKTGTLTLSVNRFLKEVVDNNSSGNFNNLARAAYNYGVAAKNYFGSN